MEGGALFDPGILGGQFLWWIGQIPDDATWRDNISVGKYPDKDGGTSGYGRRYKVRIIGIHDKTEETIPSDQLPWANVMYPVTAGSGAANAWQTSQIRQGNFVFGFWMDGPDQQVPVIMGILGNNPQTKLATSIGTSQDNFSGTSGFAASQDPAPIRAIPRVPDEDKTIVKPKTEEAQQECSSTPPGTKLNKHGLRADRPQTAAQFKDSQSARTEAEKKYNNLPEREKQAAIEKEVAEAVKKGKENRCAEANSPLAAAEPGAALESGATAPHIKDSADLVRDDLYREQTPLLKPDDKVESSNKAVQTVLDNLAVKQRKHLKSISEYSEAVSNKRPDMQPEIDQAAKDIAKFEKISVDKLMEYSLKVMNNKIASTVAAMPAANRFQYADVKEGFTKKLMEEYLDITNGLADTVGGVLKQTLNMDEKEDEARKAAASPGIGSTARTYADAAICKSEEIVGKSIALERPKIDKANEAMINNMNLYLDDVTSSLAGVTGSLNEIQNQIPAITGSVVSALQFENQKPNRFPFELPPNPSVSDFYTLAEGSGAQSDAAVPSIKAIGQIASSSLQPLPEIPPLPKVPFAEPLKNQPNIDLLTNKVENMTKELKDKIEKRANSPFIQQDFV